MLPRDFQLKRDSNSVAAPLVALSDPQTVVGTLASAQSAPINGKGVRIFASAGPIYFLIGANPTSSAVLGHPVADQSDIYQPCQLNDIVAIFGGKAIISTCGV